MIQDIRIQTQQIEALAAARSEAWQRWDAFQNRNEGDPVQPPGPLSQDIAGLWSALAASMCIIHQLLEDRYGAQETEACPSSQGPGAAPGTPA